MSNKQWQNRKVLVTGAGGFIGSQLVEELAHNGAEVRAFVHYNSRGTLGFLSRLRPGLFSKLDVVAGDLQDLPAVTAAMKDIEIVFHLGAMVDVPHSYVNPASVVETNVVGSLNVLIASRGARVRRLVYASSGDVYGTPLWIPIDEGHPLRGQSPLAASKIGAEKLVESFHRSYDLPVVTVRPFNTYGPRQSTRAVIPSIITQSLTQDVIQLGNLDAERDFTFVDDIVEGFIVAGNTPDVEGSTFNLGFGEAIKIGDLANEIFEIIGQRVNIRVVPSLLRPEKSEVQRLLADNRLAMEKLGWYPRVSLQDGLATTVKWISANLQLYRSEVAQP